jgi:hypothetical protein
MNFCIKEDIKRNIKSSLTESKQTNNTKIKLTEQELRKLIRESIDNVLTDDIRQVEDDDIKQIENDASWDAFKNTRQLISNYGNNDTLETYLDKENDWYRLGKHNFDAIMDDENGYQDKLDDLLDNSLQYSKECDGFNSMQAQRTDHPEFYKRIYKDRYSNNKRNLNQYR